MTNDVAPVRQIRSAPYCWQHKAALRHIRESFDAEKVVASALGVYVALTEIASDDSSDSFTTTHAYIGLKSGLSPRTVQDRLNRLADIGLVRIQTPALKSPSTYVLLPVAQPLPNDAQPLPNDAQPLPNVQQRGFFPPLLSSERTYEVKHEVTPLVSGLKPR